MITTEIELHQASIVYVHGNGLQPEKQILKHKWDMALFGVERPYTHMAYYADLRKDYDLTERENAILAIDPYRDASVKMWTAAFMLDLHTYFHDPDRQRLMKNRLIETIVEKSPKIVIAHSLGSVIAYDVLLSHPKPIPYLITIGSPLAWDYCISNLKQQYGDSTLKIPGSVQRWYNIIDRRDMILADKTLRETFNSRLIKDMLVKNIYRLDNYPAGAHDALGYLMSLGVRDIVYTAVGE